MGSLLREQTCANFFDLRRRYDGRSFDFQDGLPYKPVCEYRES